MRTKVVAGTALAGSLFLSTFAWQSAQAAGAPGIVDALGAGNMITLIKHGGGDGGGQGGGGNGGHMAARRGDGGGQGGDDSGRMAAGNGDGGDHAMKGGAHYKGGRISGDDDISGGGNPSGRRGHNGKFVHDHDDRHFSNRDHDHDHFNRHRVFRDGVWVWVYGPDYYAGDDCAWLLDRAEITGSPYWWRRYNFCIGYY